jgi:hypothetical protein
MSLYDVDDVVKNTLEVGVTLADAFLKLAKLGWEQEAYIQSLLAQIDDLKAEQEQYSNTLRFEGMAVASAHWLDLIGEASRSTNHEVNRIPIIKLYRELTDVGLKTAKDVVDSYINDNLIVITWREYQEYLRRMKPSETPDESGSEETPGARSGESELD